MVKLRVHFGQSVSRECIKTIALGGPFREAMLLLMGEKKDGSLIQRDSHLTTPSPILLPLQTKFKVRKDNNPQERGTSLAK